MVAKFPRRSFLSDFSCGVTGLEEGVCLLESLAVGVLLVAVFGVVLSEEDFEESDAAFDSCFRCIALGRPNLRGEFDCGVLFGDELAIALGEALVTFPGTGVLSLFCVTKLVLV
jgi:hypothetical protein